MQKDEKTGKRKVPGGRNPMTKETICIRVEATILVDADRLAHTLSRGQLAPLDRNDVLRAAMVEGLKVLTAKAVEIEGGLNNA